MVAWATTVIVIGLTVVMVWQQLHTVGAVGAAPASVGGS